MSVTPALTAAEKQAVDEIRAWCPGHEEPECIMDPSIFAFRDTVRSSLGFTMEMVLALRSAVDGAVNDGALWSEEIRLANTAIANIEALLPPEV